MRTQRIEQCLHGFFPDLSYEDYDKDPALRHSVLNRFTSSPRGTDVPVEETPAMVLGRVFHHLALTPALPLDARSLPDGVIQEAQALAQAFRESAVAKELCRHAFHESSLFWEKDQVGCKARPDILAETHLADVKTTRRLAGFTGDALAYGYHRQAAWYFDAVEAVMGIKPERALLIAIEKTGSYKIEVFELTTIDLRAARHQNALQLALFKRSLKGIMA